MRRRPNPPETFSFDSFLDLVTNVVGIIIRLILVVWVGARSYHTIKELPPTAAAKAELPPPAVAPDDPLHAEMERQRRELEAAQARLLERLRALDLTEGEARATESELAALEARREELRRLEGEFESSLTAKGSAVPSLVASLEDFQKRRERLLAELRELEKTPPARKVLRYRTPVSKPVQAEEWHFEVQGGRVTFVDVPTMVGDIRRAMEDGAKQLRTQWQITGTTEPVGAFRMHYVIERERSGVESAFDAAPRDNVDYRYGLSEWRLEPVQVPRGEAGDLALAAGSEFRHIADGLSSEYATVTFWVYPDGFELYRRLRDRLADRGIAVAGRPLPFGIPIASSRRGTASRGQ
jgi:hypothetical protein